MHEEGRCVFPSMAPWCGVYTRLPFGCQRAEGRARTPGDILPVSKMKKGTPSCADKKA